MKKMMTIMVLSLFVTTSSFAYDEAKAAEFNKAFSQVTQKNAAKSKMMVDVDEAFKMLREKKKFVFLDIRTEGETAVLGLKTENTLEIPLEHLFEKKNLDKLPTDKTIVVVCHSGSRARMAIMNLKMIGFRNTRIMKGGIVALAIGDNVKNAPLK